MIANVLIVVSFFALAAWIFRKYAMRQDDMGKKEDDDTFESQQRGSWFDVGDDQSFRRRMLYPFYLSPAAVSSHLFRHAVEHLLSPAEALLQHRAHGILQQSAVLSVAVPLQQPLQLDQPRQPFLPLSLIHI